MTDLPYELHDATLAAAAQRHYNGFGLGVVISHAIRDEIVAGRLIRVVRPTITAGVVPGASAHLVADSLDAVERNTRESVQAIRNSIEDGTLSSTTLIDDVPAHEVSAEPQAESEPAEPDGFGA